MDSLTQRSVRQLIGIAQGWYALEVRERTLVLMELRFGQIGFDPDRSRIMWQYTIEPQRDGKVTVERIPETPYGFFAVFGDLGDRILGI